MIRHGINEAVCTRELTVEAYPHYSLVTPALHCIGNVAEVHTMYGTCIEYMPLEGIHTWSIHADHPWRGG